MFMEKIITPRGVFREYVLEFKLMKENAEVITCSREENTEDFWATVGGMGLQGLFFLSK